MTITLSTLLNKAMSLITIEQFDEFVEANPEMEQCYILGVEEDYDPTTDSEDEYFRALRWMEVL